MNRSILGGTARWHWNTIFCLAWLTTILPQCSSKAAGVTLVTHGFELASSYPAWVTAMADDIPTYPQFPGINFTTYRITVGFGSTYTSAIVRTNGSPPSATDSGEIIIELDWTALSGDLFDSYASTIDVATVVSKLLMQTNLTPELEGHALAEFPLHLIGHSRGGSLVSELARQLGTNGVWVDHVTTLDPYPINNDGNHDSPATVVDASASNTWANVLFADNYWQKLGAGFLEGDPDGEPVSGAYRRQLTSLSGGYNNDHSNDHLWYHGTIDLATPANDGPGGGTITAAQRSAWWVAAESQGALAGFYYSLIGGGNRLSSLAPLGAAYPAINSGYNQMWNLGAGNTTNRTKLAANNGSWPNLIKFNRTDTNQVPQNGSVSVTYYYQWAGTNATPGTISFYLDNDRNPLNTGQTLLAQINIATNGATTVASQTIALPLTSATPGPHTLFAVITGGGRTRYLYAPEPVQIIPAAQPPTLAIARLSSSQVQITVSGSIGQTLILQTASTLTGWQPTATNTLTASSWIFTDTVAGASQSHFYRAVVGN